MRRIQFSLILTLTPSVATEHASDAQGCRTNEGCRCRDLLRDTEVSTETRPNFYHRLIFLVMTVALTAGLGLVRAEEAVDRGVLQAYVAKSGSDLLSQYAPVFVVEHAELTHNLIGTPSARRDEHDKEVIFVNSSQPTVYAEQVEFTTENRRYTNYIYRAHFERSPFTWTPFNANAGRNVGIMVVVTVDEEGIPLFVNTVHTCGCYHAVIPTSYLPRNAYPSDWDDGGFSNYGEALPGLLTYDDKFDAAWKPVIFVRSGTHRIMDVTVQKLEEVEAEYNTKTLPILPVDTLKQLSMSDDAETSFYFTEGRKRGLVKGAFKPWETILFGLWVGDFHVGQDREYGSKEEVGRLFYTTLNRRKKQASDMADYAGFLRLNGWNP